VLSSALAFAACGLGLLVSYHADWPTSPVIVLCLGVFYLGSLLLGRQGVLRGYRKSPVHLKA
jgi:zinc/manganese transport system permease protein